MATTATSAATIAAKLTLDTRDYNNGLSDAEKKSQSFSKKLGSVGQTLTKVGGIMTASLTLPIVAGFGKMIDAASDMEQAAGAVNTVFGQSAYIIEDFGRRSATAVGLAESDFNQLAAVTGSFLQNLGYDADSAAQETLVLTERASDMAAVFNTDVSQALQAIQSGLKGEFNPLEQFGVKINQAAINARALEMGLADATGAIDDNAKAQAALSLVMEQTDRIAGQFASESETFAVKMQVLKAEFKDTAAELGTNLLPYAIKLLEWANDAIQTFNELPEPVKKGALAFAGLVAVAGPLLMVAGQLVTVIPKLSTAIGGLSATIMSAVSGIGLLVGALIVLWDVARKNRGKLDDITSDAEKSAITYAQYVRETTQAMKEQGWVLGENGRFYNAYTGEMDKSVRVMSSLEWSTKKAIADNEELGAAFKKSGFDAGYYADMAAMAGKETNRYTDALAEQSAAMDSTKFKAYLTLTETYTDTLDDINTKQDELNGLLELQADQGYGYYEGTWYSASQLETKIGDVRGEVEQLKTDMSSTANQMVLDMAMTEAAIDGIITPEEYTAIQNLGVELGEFSQEAADTAITEFDRAFSTWENWNPANKSATVTVTEVHRTVYTSDAANEYHWQAAGGFETANQPTLVGYGEAGPETAVFIPKGKTIFDVASANQIASIMPGIVEGQTNNQEVTNNYNINATIPQDEIIPTLEQIKAMT